MRMRPFRAMARYEPALHLINNIILVRSNTKKSRFCPKTPNGKTITDFLFYFYSLWSYKTLTWVGYALKPMNQRHKNIDEHLNKWDYHLKGTNIDRWITQVCKYNGFLHVWHQTLIFVPFLGAESETSFKICFDERLF